MNQPDQSIPNVEKISDDELRFHLERFGVSVGFISTVTRPLYQRQLIKKQSQSTDTTEIEEKITESPLANEYNKPELVIKSQTIDADVYYGVYIPEDKRPPEADGIVYTDTADCIGTMKKYPGARFKGFCNYEDALNFSFNGPPCVKTCSLSNSLMSSEAEKPSPFRGPKSQDLIKFRKAIEKGQFDNVLEFIDSNPRYIVSGADAPTILQEGFRYNAIHVTCRSNQPELCSKILEIVEDPFLFQRIYPDEDIDIAIRRSRHLLDLYLNTPDKGMNETPLHFACKNGFMECARVLTSYVDCIKDMQNKYDETPQQIICSRAKSKDAIKVEEIRSLFEERLYVPICRDEDNCMIPTVGSPFSLTSDQSPISHSNSPTSCTSMVVSPSYKVRGLGGPMSPQKAEIFYNRLRRSSVPSSTPKGKVASMRIVDHEKGLERVGRDVAADLNVEWKEHWHFLGEFVNIASSDGLQKLENHLQRKYREVLESCNIRSSQKCLSHFEDSFDTHYSLTDGQNNVDTSPTSVSSGGSTKEICTAMEALRLNVSVSPSHAYMDYRPSSSDYSESQATLTLNWNDLSFEEKLEDSSHTLEKDAVSFYNYCFRSAQITSQKVANLLLDLCENLQDQTPSDYSLMKNFIRSELSPEIFHLRSIVRKTFHGPNLRSFDLGFIHLLLAAEATEIIMKELSPHSLFLLNLAFKSHAATNAIEYFNIEDYDLFEEFSLNERQDRIRHLSCVVKKVAESLSLAIKSSKTQEVEKISLKSFDKCVCNWAFVCQNGTTSSDFRFRPINSHFKTSNTPERKVSFSSKNSSRMKRVSSWLHRFLFGEKEEEILISQEEITFEKPLAHQLTFDDENCDCDSDSDSFATAQYSSGSDEKQMATPEEFITFYIEGNGPSKVDLDVLNALEHIDIDENAYPRIHEWSSLISATPVETRNSWASPCCRRVNRLELSSNIRDSPPPKLASFDDSLTSDQLRRSLLARTTLSHTLNGISTNVS